jgi:hypothetical protein
MPLGSSSAAPVMRPGPSRLARLSSSLGAVFLATAIFRVGLGRLSSLRAPV